MANIAAVVKGDALLQNGGFRTQDHLDAPLHSVYAVYIPHGDRDAPVCVFGKGKIDRRKRHPIVRHRKVVLHTKCRPGSAISDSRLLDRRIGIKHRPTVDLVDACVKMTSEIRQNGAFQILVLKEDGSPLVIGPTIREVRSQRIRIVEANCGQLIEWRVGVWKAFLIRRD